MNARIVILTKEPTPGSVKTRLIPAIGPEAATRLHTAMVWETIERAQSTGLPVHVALAGDMSSSFADALRHKVTAVEPQVHGDLGQRMAHALKGPGRAIALGTDCVLFEPTWLIEAAQATAPVVIGPAEDGGYWLIAACGDNPTIFPALFNNMAWSTDSVCKDTADRLQEIDQTIHWLPSSYDIDTVEDLERLRFEPHCPSEIRDLLKVISPTEH